MVRTFLFTIAISIFLFADSANANRLLDLFFPNRNNQSGSRPGKTFGVKQDRRAHPNATHGESGVCLEKCKDNNSLKAISTESIPIRGGLALGVDRTLVNLFRSCGANKPLRNLITSDKGRIITTYNSQYRQSGLRANNFGGTIGIRRNIVNGKWVAQNGPYYAMTRNGECSNPKVDGKSIDMSLTPTIFQNGATLTYVKHQGQGLLNPYTCVSNPPNNGHCNMDSSSKPAIALDCMEFVTTAMASACLKFTKNDDFTRSPGPRFLGGGKGLEVSNKTVASTIGKKNSCFTDIKMNSPDFLKEGDLLFGSSSPNHAVVITDIENPQDPFGIDSHSGSCDNMTAANFRFSVAQSTSEDNLGPSKIRASDFVYFIHRNLKEKWHLKRNGKLALKNPNYPFPLNQLLVRAIQLCKHKKEKKRLPPASLDPKYHFVRHKGSDPKCRMSKKKCPHVIGDECANYCEKKQK